MYMSVLLSLFLSAIFLGIASLMGKYVVESAVELSNLLRIRTIIFGFIFVSLSTSLPELAVAVFSSLEGESGISFGNLIGSNVVNMCLIFSILIWNGMKISSENRKLIRNSLFFVILVCLVLLLSNTLSIEISLFLILIFFLYLRAIRNLYIIPLKKYEIFTLELVKNIFVFVFACISVIIFSKLAIGELVKLSKIFGFESLFLGSTLVAIETSFPELIVAINALKKKRYEISIGDITGSSVVNITLILGMAGIFSIITLGIVEKIIVIFALISACTLNLLSLKHELSRKDSLLLLFIFLMLMIFLMNFQCSHFG